MKWRPTALGLVLLLLTTGAAYLPSIDGEFVMDDVDIVRDPLVVNPFSSGLVSWLQSPRPVLAATFALTHAVAGFEARAWHLGNVFIHLLAVLLAWRLALGLLRRAGLREPGGPALAAAGLFALHPLQTESVSYISQRAESLAGLLYLAALLVLLASEGQHTRGRRLAVLAVASGIHLLGLLVKPVVATLPAAWLLVALFLPLAAEETHAPWRRLLARLPAAAPLLMLSAVAAVRGVLSTSGADDAGFGMPHLPLGRYLATQSRVIPAYVGRFAWPGAQCADCFFPVCESALDPLSLAGAAFLAASLAVTMWIAFRTPATKGPWRAAARTVAFGVWFFLLTLLPSSLVPLRDPFVEHRVYLGVFGLSLACACLGAVALHRWTLRPAHFGSAVALVVLLPAAVATARRNGVWASRLEFYRDAAETAPLKARTHNNLGVALLQVGRSEEALASFRRAAQLDEDRSASPRTVFENLIAALMATRRLDEARGFTRGVLEYEPEDSWALALAAEVEYWSGHTAESRALATAALRRNPGELRALKYLGLALLRTGPAKDALGPLRAAASGLRADFAVHLGLGEAEEATGNRAAACAALAQAAASPAAPDQLALARATSARLGCN